jgi:DHA2 family multidrug resistance protein
MSMPSARRRALLEQIRAALVARGSDVVTAGQQALVVLEGLVRRQAAALVFTDVFRLLGVLFLLVLPLLFLMRRPRSAHGAGAAH